MKTTGDNWNRFYAVHISTLSQHWRGTVDEDVGN